MNIDEIEHILTEDALNTSDIEVRKEKLLRRDLVSAIIKNLPAHGYNKETCRKNIVSSVDAFCDAFLSIFLEDIKYEFRTEFINSVAVVFGKLLKKKGDFLTDFHKNNL